MGFGSLREGLWAPKRERWGRHSRDTGESRRGPFLLSGLRSQLHDAEGLGLHLIDATWVCDANRDESAFGHLSARRWEADFRLQSGVKGPRLHKRAIQTNKLESLC
jgi:hypothetical protein